MSLVIDFEMRRIIFFCIIVFEISIIAFLATKIYLEKPQILGKNISINPISKEDIVFSNSDIDFQLNNFYEPKPNLKITKKSDRMPPDYEYTITINKDGLNERYDYNEEKKDNVFRIIALGDSYTYGWDVDTTDNYPERLENLLNNNLQCKITSKFEVINLGVGGYDIEYSVYRYKKRGQKYNPDLILFYLGNNDFSRIRDIEIDIFEESEKNTEDLVRNKMEEQLSARKIFRNEIRNNLRKKIGTKNILDYQIEALRKIKDYYYNELILLTRSEINNEYMDELLDFSKEYKDINIKKIIVDYDHFPVDSHPTSKGYSQIALEIFNYLVKNKLVYC